MLLPGLVSNVSHVPASHAATSCVAAAHVALWSVAVVFKRPSGLDAWLVSAALLVATGVSGVRWIRVAQREHYGHDACGRFAMRWWLSTPVNAALVVIALAGLVLSARYAYAGVGVAVVVGVGPVGLTLRGRTSPLRWTRRAKTLAAVWVCLQCIVFVVGIGIDDLVALSAAGALLVPVLVDVADTVVAPVERWASSKYVATASGRLRRVRPFVVAITGSYGQTSTKNHVVDLVGASKSVVASPASFNNRAGLARTVNESLSEGSEVLVAEMGTYAPGEIAELCGWCPPDVAVITQIGPVHLERFGSEDRIVEAKAEIARSAPVVVLNTDNPRLRALGEQLALRGGSQRVIRCSTSETAADVCVVREDGSSEVTLWLNAEIVGTAGPVSPGVQESNVACAVAVALEVGLTGETILERIGGLREVPNRLVSVTSESGVTVIDDTFNSNPAGARAAVGVLSRTTSTGRRVVVTPGMVEMGKRQFQENKEFAVEAARVATDLVVVGRTNRRALLAGAGSLRPVSVPTREEAVRWVKSTLVSGDAVLYENDLPDHYP